MNHLVTAVKEGYRVETPIIIKSSDKIFTTEDLEGPDDKPPDGQPPAELEAARAKEIPEYNQMEGGSLLQDKPVIS